MVSSDTVTRLMVALGKESAGNEVATILNNSATGQAQAASTIAAAIVAAHTSTTTDFAALAVGDLLVHIPATAGNAAFETVATAGTKPSAAVIGDLYLAIRKVTFPKASAATL